MVGPEFWQRLLAAETSTAKSQALMQGLGSSASSPDLAVRELLASPLLTEVERSRAADADLVTLRKAMDRGVFILEPAGYPQLLAQEVGGPPALFVDGDTAPLHGPTVAIVGTRSASTYGRACARKFAEALGRAGVCIVSGGALGIDGEAHEGAVSVGAKTVAVLGCGVDVVYPGSHAGLFRRIREQGCLVSQFAVGSRPADFHFLLRNGLIAMLSRAVLVIEAPRSSGALRTADAAANLGREVFVVPGTIDRASFAGSHGLIRDGATLVDHPDQILESLRIEPTLPFEAPSASVTGSKILEILGVDAVSPELIVAKTGLNASEVLSELTMLELEGLIMRAGTGYVRKL